MSPSLVEPVPADLFSSDDFIAAIDPADLVYFLLNVGDGDTQLVLLPADPNTGHRQALIVDVYRVTKLEALLEELEKTPLMNSQVVDEAGFFAAVVATHPHADHITGMAAFINRFHASISELWEPGYFIASNVYMAMMVACEEHALNLVQPTSGSTRFIGQSKLTCLGPGISLRNNFDTYGVDPNNSSISLKIEFPAARVVRRERDRTFVRGPVRSLILGADAQTRSWAQAMVDFPELRASDSPVAKAMDKTQGHYPLNADYFKVPHHGSKHGLNLELVEMIKPKLSLISSVKEAGKYNFPHLLALEALREASDQISGSPTALHKPDHELGIHVTGATDDAHLPLGTIALIATPPNQRSRPSSLWRFGDTPEDDVVLGDARRYLGL